MTLFEKRLRVDLQVAKYNYYFASDIEIKQVCKGTIVLLEDMLLQVVCQHAESFDVFE